MTALVAPVIVGAAGIAVDFNVGVTTKSTLQGAVDAAILTAASSGETDAKKLRALFDKALAGNYKPEDGAVPTITDFKLDGKFITVNATIDVPLTFTKVFTDKDFKVAVLSQAVAGSSNLVDIALVLDNTYSMTGQKLADLKTASNALFDVFEKADTKKTQARFGIVPFSKYVNVGTNQRGQSWLSVAADTSTTKTENKCTTTKPIVSQDCTKTTKTTYNDGVPVTSTQTTCTNQVYGPETTTCKDVTTTSTNKWYGCVYSRAEGLDTSDALTVNNVVKRYTGIMGNTTCGSAIQPLTNDYKVLRAAIAAMVANNETYIAPGVLWGWNVLSPDAPFTEGYAYGAQNKKYVVIMTDGANTIYPKYVKNQDYSGHNSAGAPTDKDYAAYVKTSDGMLTTTCSNVKKAGIAIFTVAVGVDEKGTAEALASCATTTDMAFTTKDSSELTKIFGAIAAQIMTPRLTM